MTEVKRMKEESEGRKKAREVAEGGVAEVK